MGWKKICRREACDLLPAVSGTSGLLGSVAEGKVPVERLLSDLIEDSGPLLYHGDSEEQQSSFESTCKRFRRFLTQPAR